LLLPFQIIRNSTKTLVDQITDGLREAITCGVYKPGDSLPPMRVFTEQFGVSRIVMNEVVARLKGEGLINARPRLGCVVLSPDERLWKGRVLMVNPIGDDNYFNNVYSGIIRDALIGSEYMYLSCVVPQLDTKEYDMSVLRHILRSSVNLVVLSSLKPKIVECVAKAGVRYVTISQFASQSDVRPPCASAVIDWNVAMKDFVADVKSAGIRTVEQVSWIRSLSDALSPLAEIGVSTREWRISVNRSLPRIYAVKDAAYRAFKQRLSKSDPELPELFYFADDRLAEGAFLAMAECGLRVPEDVGVVTWANYGLGPVFGKELSRMEMNPFEEGRRSASWILEVLEGRRDLSRLVIGPVYIPGATLSAGHAFGKRFDEEKKK